MKSKALFGSKKSKRLIPLARYYLKFPKNALTQKWPIFLLIDAATLCTVHMTFTDIEEYNLRSIAILGCNIYSQITVAHVTQPKVVLGAVKIFAVYAFTKQTFPFESRFTVDTWIGILVA